MTTFLEGQPKSKDHHIPKEKESCLKVDIFRLERLFSIDFAKNFNFDGRTIDSSKTSGNIRDNFKIAELN